MKRFFITPFTTLSMGLMIHAAVVLVRGPFSLAWLGALLGASALPLYIGWLMGLKPARANPLAPSVLLATVSGVALAGVGWSGSGGGPLPLGYSAVALLGALAYIFWYSVLDRPPSDLEVGQALPSVEFRDDAGATVSSDSYRGSPALFMFFRGNWCPLCMAQIKEIAAQYRELGARGVKTVLVSGQSHKDTQELAVRFDVPFDFLVDDGYVAARRLGLLQVGGTPAGMEVLGFEADTMLPTVILTDHRGIILFCDQTDNYRVRPEPETFLRVLDGRSPEADPAELAESQPQTP